MVNVKAFMANETIYENVGKIEAVIEEDKETCALLDAAKSVEDVFSAVKKYVVMKYEAFTELFDDVMNYFKEDKAELSDETLDCVVGGWSWSGLWQHVKRNATAILIGAAVGAAVGAVAGAATAAGVGAIIGAAAGAIAGAVATAMCMD